MLTLNDHIQAGPVAVVSCQVLSLIGHNTKQFSHIVQFGA